MLSKIIACVGLILVACGDVQEADFVTEQGLQVWTNGLPVSQQEMEYVTLSVVNNLASRYNKAKMLKFLSEAGLEVEWLDSSVPCPYEYECIGLFDMDSGTILLTYYDCIALSSLAHELIHAIQWEFQGYANYQHSDTSLFGAIWSVEEISTREIFRYFKCER
jgi:hypothetical protein